MMIIRLFALLMLSKICWSAPTRKLPSDLPEAPFKAANGCRLVINEVNLWSTSAFIELARYCKDDLASIQNKIDLGKFAVLVLDEDDFIVGYCLLSKTFNTNGRWYFIVGDSENENPNIKDCQWDQGYIDGGNLQLPWMTTRFGVFLIRNEQRNVLEYFSLHKVGLDYSHKKVIPSLKRLLLANLQDFYIFSSDRFGAAFPSVFSDYYSGYMSDEHIVYFDSSEPNLKGISRCGSRSSIATYSLPLQSQLMKTAEVSPGKINECRDAEPPKKRPRIEVEVLPIGCTDIPREDPEMQCDATSPFKFEVVNTNEFESQLESSPEFFWDDCKSFPKEKIKLIQQIPFNPVDVADILVKPVCNWIDYLVPQNKLVCKKCIALLKQKIIIDRTESPFLTKIIKTGDIKLAKSDEFATRARKSNQKMFLEHQSSTLHKITDQYFDLFSAGKRGEELKKALEEEGSPYRAYYKATENVALSVTQAIKMNIPFRSFPIFAETLDHFGVHIGHLYRTPEGARMISDVVGNKLHKDLIAQLLKLNNELSITLDSTTDIAGYGLLGIIFQTFDESGDVNVFLYRVMHLPKGEKGEELFTQFMESIEADGLTNYIKQKTVGLTTDGHPAVRKVFRRMLNDKIDNELVGVWCSAHVLELIATKAFEEFPFLLETDEFINRVFRLLTTKSPLRREEFRQQIPLFGFRLFEFKRVRKLRWLGHHVRALSPFVYRYPVIVRTLEILATDKKHNLKTRTEARELLLLLKDATFVATIAFTADILDVLAAVSGEYQRYSNTLIGKKKIRDGLQLKLAALENNYGAHIMYILENSEAIGGNLYNDPLVTFESSKIKLEGIILNDPEEFYEDYRVSSKMESYVDAILVQLDEYYPGDILDNYDVFLPANFPTVLGMDNQAMYGREKILELNNKLKWNYDTEVLIEDWHNLLTSLLAHPDFKNALKLYPEEFWTKFLKSEYIEWTPITREIIKKALTIPASSSQPERVFSMYTYVKSYQRYNLLPATVENIIRIKFNGKKEISEWNMVDMAKEIISEKHSRSDDMSRRKTWKKLVEDFEIEEEDGLDQMIEESQSGEQDEDEVALNF